MITTERLYLRPATDEEMQALMDNAPCDELRKAYGEMLCGCRTHPDKRIFYAAWIVTDKNQNTVGDLCFKGLSADGVTEIGYGIEEAYQNRGYATEAVKAAVSYMAAYPGVTRIEAEAEDGNAASLTVLRKCGFVSAGCRGEEGERFYYKG